MENHEPVEIVDRRAQSMEESQSQPASVLTEVDRVFDEPLPLFNQILVRKEAAETYFQGTRFVIPEASRKSPNEGVVVAIGSFYIVDGKQFLMKEIVNPGDLVKFSVYNGEDVQIDGETFHLISIFDVKFVKRVHYAIDQPVRS